MTEKDPLLQARIYLAEARKLEARAMALVEGRKAAAHEFLGGLKKK